jgi:hypothetical protein
MDIKISDTKMEETIEQAPKVITHDFEDLIKRRQEAVEQAELYASIVKDFDALIKRMETAGCVKPIEKTEAIDGK